MVDNLPDYQIVVKDSSAILGMSNYDVEIPYAGMYSFMTIYSHIYTNSYKVYIIDLDENEVLVDSAFVFSSNQVLGGVQNPITYVLGSVIIGCTDEGYLEYNPDAEADDDSCETIAILGCTDSLAFNYNSLANLDDGSCIEELLGCTDSDACNYNPLATTDDGSCQSIEASITNYSFNSPSVSVVTEASGAAYEWFYEGNLLSELSSTLVPELNGLYNVLIIDDAGCSTSLDFSITTLDVSKLNHLNFNAFPNPGSKKLVLTVPEGIVGAIIELVSLNGMTHLSKLVSSTSKRVEIDVSNIPIGMYILNLSYENKTSNTTWIKK